MKIEIISGPDILGRFVYWKKWEDTQPAYCLSCGADPTRKCECYGKTTERAQIFHAKLPTKGGHNEKI